MRKHIVSVVFTILVSVTLFTGCTGSETTTTPPVATPPETTSTITPPSILTPLPPYAGLENPFSWNDTSTQVAGELIYQYSCEMCHKQEHGYEFLPQGPDLSTADFAQRLEERPDFYFWALSEGMLTEYMPALKSTIPEEQRWQVLTYIWSLGGTAPVSTPTPTSTLIPTPTPTPTEELTVHFIDVDQGDSILVDLGETEILIDGGKSPGVVAYLDDHVDGALEVMIATHPHVDHIGGLIAVLGAFEVQEIWHNNDASSSQTYAELMAAVQAEGAEVRVGSRGEEIYPDKLTFTILNPIALTGSANNNSIVLSLSYGEVDFLFMGDAENEAEGAMLIASDMPI